MRISTFDNIGTDVSNSHSSQEVLANAGLDYTVVKKPMYYAQRENYIEFPDKMFTVNESSNKILGVVSKKYEVCQNREAFDFIDYIGKDNPDFEYVKAGETNGGLVYIIAKIADTTILGDKITPYIIFQNSHDGFNSIKATVSPLRIICQNQFNLSFRESSNTVRIVHSSQMDSKLITARNMMNDVVNYMDTFEGTAETLATKKVSHDTIIKIFNEVFKYNPEKMSNRQKDNFELSRAEFLSCYKSEDNQNFIGTAWGVVNGAADYLTHRKAKRQTSADSVFVNTTLLSVALNNIYKQLVAA
jgi:phage/plasmid-like protein (TIGR03299 family)